MRTFLCIAASERHSYGAPFFGSKAVRLLDRRTFCILVLAYYASVNISLIAILTSKAYVMKAAFWLLRDLVFETIYSRVSITNVALF
jgi:hypothetical protein